MRVTVGFRNRRTGQTFIRTVPARTLDNGKAKVHGRLMEAVLAGRLRKTRLSEWEMMHVKVEGRAAA